MKKQKKKQTKNAPTLAALNVTKKQTYGVVSDPQGSYTGTPSKEDEKPVQDVDDL